MTANGLFNVPDWLGIRLEVGIRQVSLDMVQAEGPDAHARLRVGVADPAAALHVADPFDAQERLELLDLELDAAVHEGAEHLDLLLLVHPLLDHVERDGLVPLPAADERLEELERRRRVEIRDQRGHAPEPEALGRVLLLPFRGDRLDRLQDRLVVRRLVDVRRVRVRGLGAHRFRVRVDVPDESELLVFLVSREDERHLVADVGGPLVREDPQDGGAFLQALRHEEIHEDFLPDVGGSVDRGVRAERDASEHEVVQARDAGLHLLLFHLDLQVLLAGLDVLFDGALLPPPEFLHLLLEVFLLRPHLFFLLVDLPLQLFEARLHVELIRRAALRFGLLDLPSLALHDLLAVQEVFLPPEAFFLFVGERLLHLPNLVLLDLEIFLQPLEVLLPEQDRPLPLEDIVLFLRNGASNLRLRLALEDLRLFADPVLDLVLPDLAFQDDDPPLELLFLREVVLLHLPELLLESPFQLLARRGRLIRMDRRDAFLVCA